MLPPLHAKFFKTVTECGGFIVIVQLKLYYQQNTKLLISGMYYLKQTCTKATSKDCNIDKKFSLSMAFVLLERWRDETCRIFYLPMVDGFFSKISLITVVLSLHEISSFLTMLQFKCVITVITENLDWYPVHKKVEDGGPPFV